MNVITLYQVFQPGTENIIRLINTDDVIATATNDFRNDPSVNILYKASYWK